MPKLHLVWILLLGFTSQVGWSAQTPRPWAQATLSSNTAHHLTTEIQVLADPQENLDIKQVQELWVAGSPRFLAAQQSGFQDYSDGVYWSALWVKNSSAQFQKWILKFDDQYSNTIDVYRAKTSADGALISPLEHSSTGSWVPLKKRNPLSSSLIYPIEIIPGESFVLFTRFKTLQRANIGVRLMSPDFYTVEMRRHDFTFQMYFGALFGLFLFNLVIFIYTRSRIYFYYLLFEGSIGLMYFGATGHGDEFLPFTTQGWSSLLPYLRIMTSLGALTFGYHFLRVRQIAPKLRWIYYEIGTALTLDALFCIVGKYAWAAQLYDIHVVPSFVLLMISAFLGLRKNLWEAKCYLVSWTPFFAGVVIWILEGAGILERSLLTVASIPFGNGLEMTLLALGLAHQIKSLETQLRESAEERSVILGQKLDGVQRTLFQSSKLSAIGEMAGGMAHEINNPLSIIHMSAERLETLIEEKADPNQFKDPLQKIKKMTVRISSIIESLRNFSKDVSQSDRKTVLIGDVVSMTLDLCREKFISQGIELLVEIPSDPLSVKGSRVLLSQACFSLLTNAFEAVQDAIKGGKLLKGKDAWVRIQVRHESKYVYIRVLNAGPKILPEVASKVFIPFFTSKDIQHRLGLGLSQALGIAQSHGGDLKVDLAEAMTCFEFKLPLV